MPFFELLDRFSMTYGDKKGLPLSEAVPLCGVVNKNLTIFEDFNMVYLFGIQTIGVFKKY